MEKRGDEKPGPDGCLSELEDFREIGEVPAAVLGDEHHVFNADCPQSRIIQPWFNRDDVALLEE